MPKPTKLPYGSGSIQLRGRVWWMIYRDAAEQVTQENSRTEDQADALRLLANRAIRTMRSRIAVLKAIADGRPEDQSDGRRRAGGRPEPVGRPDRIRARRVAAGKAATR